MEIKNLSQTPFNIIVDCFFSAFENYFVEFPKDKFLFKNRWEMASINYSFSYGMFNRDKLVGFVLHGIENRESYLTAFNLATGVIPEYRGKKIIQQIYEYALDELKAIGVTKCKLEVIKENKTAIEVYKKIGYNIIKSYKCFGGNIEILCEVPFELKKIKFQDFNFEDKTAQSLYSWENQIATLKRGDFKCYQVLHDNNIESIFIINDQNGYLAQFDVLIESKNAWKRLFSAIHSISKEIKINNIDARLITKICQIYKFGLNNTVDQYEMEMLLD
ncbi:GNAT family N-acetyltransferase [Sabulilitoribacter multivorans]|uniref:GNAT family N-acetyltransferase n=1 Tax=Flaviramulus multivorans TaxID=1304750 RepID=A0ABS9IEQ1_9FLAO|nr:GNAT family N-acetyltransferase [Flaviramulus multivorans]MCF7559011.1 GNAT family N-acetyltransferase [Flaviramulus multivorans]